MHALTDDNISMSLLKNALPGITEAAKLSFPVVDCKCPLVIVCFRETPYTSTDM